MGKAAFLFLCCFPILSVLATPRLRVPPEGVAFGEVAAGEEASKTVEVRNVSGDAVAVSQVKGCCGAEVSLSPMRVEPQAAATLSVRIKPDAIGEFSRQVRILCDDPGCPVVSVPVSGVVVAAQGGSPRDKPPCERAVPLCCAAVLCIAAAFLFMKVRRSVSPASCLRALSRLCLGGVFVYAGAMKLCDVDAFASLVARYEMLPGSTSGVVAAFLPAAECIVGLALMFTSWVRTSGGIVSAMLAAFIVALVQAAVRGLDVSCGCFGGVSSSSLIPAVFRDLAMLAVSIWLALSRSP